MRSLCVRPSTRRSSAVACGLWRSRAVVCGRVRPPRFRSRFLCGPVRSSAVFRGPVRSRLECGRVSSAVVCGPVRSCAVVRDRVRSCAVVRDRVRSCAISCDREQILLILRYKIQSLEPRNNGPTEPAAGQAWSWTLDARACARGSRRGRDRDARTELRRAFIYAHGLGH